MQGVPANYRPPSFLIPRKDPFAGEWDPEWVDLRSFVFDNDELSASASASQIECAAAADAAGASAPDGRGQAPVSDTSTPQAGSMVKMDVTGADLLRSGSSGNSTIGSQHKQQEPIKSADGLVGSSAKPQRVPKERAPGNKSALLQASVPPALPSRMQRIGLPAGENPLVRQLHRDGASTVRRPSKVASKGGRPRRKAAQENKAAKDTEDPLVKLERAVALLDRGLLSVREYELLKQHILTDLLSTALGWPATAQDQGRGGGRPLEDACSFTARERGSSASEVGTGRVRDVGSSTPASVRHAKSHTLEPTAAVEPAQHGAKVDGGSRRPPAFAAESLEPISCSPTAVGVTVAVQSHIQVQARKAMVRGKQQEASKPLATSPRSAAATRCGAKGPSSVGEDAKTRPLARGRARGERRSPSAAHASSGWGRSIPADRLDISSSTAGAQRTVSREFIMGWGRGKSAAQQFSPATARGTIVSSASDRELVRKFVRESILGDPEKYQVPYHLKPRKDPFAGEWDPDWVVLGGSDNDEQTWHSSAGGLVDAEADAAGASALRGRGQVPVSDTSTLQTEPMVEMVVTGTDLLRSGGSGNSAIGSEHKQLIVSQSDVGSQLQQVCEA